ncbi:MAG: sulfite exporter TauE/SafE family protein [Micavibrio sp.]|nr:sulfite exporter TauE/SafE family protein [Micavibrio sp.]
MSLLLAATLLIPLGVVAGLLAGLLGIGGGAVLVPGIYYILVHMGYEAHAMHVAVGTSLITIIFTGISSAVAHHRRGALDFLLLKSFLPGVVFGVLAGTWMAEIFSSLTLKIIFSTSQILFGSYMILRTNKTHLFEKMPRQPFLSIVSAANAALATLMGVGGGVQNVTFMTICNVQIHKAIGIAAAIGPFTAVIGSVGFIWIGLNEAGLPPYSLGYINFPAAAVIILSSIFCAPLGAHMAHKLPVPKLKRVFAIFMLIVAAKMLIEIFY